MSRTISRVGISAVPRDVTTGYGPDRADTAAAGMVRGVVAAGGVPLVLPVVDARASAAQVEPLDALVLSGGQDLDAELMGRERHPLSTWLDPARDLHERALAEAAFAAGIPVLGICRGLQLAVELLGGELVDHLEGHDTGSGDPALGHAVDVAADTALVLATGPRPQVNTIHHQAVAAVPAGLRVTGRAPDGTIEAVEGHTASSFLGVQWHPELMLDHPAGQPVFDALMRMACTWGRDGALASSTSDGS